MFIKEDQSFSMDSGTYISGRSPEALQSLCADFIECGTFYHRLQQFAAPPVLDSMYKAGLVFQAFTSKQIVITCNLVLFHLKSWWGLNV